MINKEKPIYSFDQIQEKVKEAAKWIESQSFEQPPILIGVLNGCIRFYGDLLNYLDIDVEMDFVSISSYNGTKSTGEITLLKDIKKNIENRDVIIVEDIVDTGLSIKWLDGYLKSKNPKSLQYLILVTRKGATSPVELDHVCLEVNDEYIVGYGFDVEDKYRTRNGIYEYIQK